MESQFFEKVKQQEVKITGGRCGVPILYHDIFAISAAFVAPAAALQGLLPTSKLVPAEIWPGKGLLALMAFDYRDTSIGPYREMALAIPVRYRPRLNVPFIPVLRMSVSLSFEIFIWQLPLDSELALNAGIDIWGLPKFLAQIEISQGDASVSCSLAEEGKHILTLEVKTKAAKMKTYFDYIIYSEKDGRLLMTRVDGLSSSLGRSFRPGTARLELGDHPLSRLIREMAPGKSMQTLYIPRSQMILPQAEAHLDL
jgi:hypothetical protein